MNRFYGIVCQGKGHYGMGYRVELRLVKDAGAGEADLSYLAFIRVCKGSISLFLEQVFGVGIPG